VAFSDQNWAGPFWLAPPLAILQCRPLWPQSACARVCRGAALKHVFCTVWPVQDMCRKQIVNDTCVYLQHVCTYSSSEQGSALTLLALFTSAPAVTSSLTTAVWSGCGEGALGGWGRGEQSHQCIFL